MTEINGPEPPAWARPRIWTVLALPAIVLGFTIAVQIIFSVALVVTEVVKGVDPEIAAENMVQRLAKPGMFIAMAAASQLVIGAAALGACVFSPTPFLQRIGLVRPNVPLWAHPVAACAYDNHRPWPTMVRCRMKPRLLVVACRSDQACGRNPTFDRNVSGYGPPGPNPTYGSCRSLQTPETACASHPSYVPSPPRGEGEHNVIPCRVTMPGT